MGRDAVYKTQAKLNVSLLRAHKQAAIKPIDVLEIFFYKHILDKPGVIIL